MGLEFSTYELGWIRYKNAGADGDIKLDLEGITEFPFARINNGSARIRMAELEEPGFIEELVERHEIEYNEASIVGSCDTQKLAAKSTDVFCVPGTKGMNYGNVFLVLYNPDTFEIAALTTTVDNTAGGALKESWLPTPVPAPAAAHDSGGAQTGGEYVQNNSGGHGGSNSGGSSSSGNSNGGGSGAGNSNEGEEPDNLATSEGVTFGSSDPSETGPDGLPCTVPLGCNGGDGTGN